MPDPFLTDRVNELAHNLVEELENIMADQDPRTTRAMVAQLGGLPYARYLAIRPILTGLHGGSALTVLVMILAEILALGSESLEAAKNSAEVCSDTLNQTLKQCWDTKVLREKKH